MLELIKSHFIKENPNEQYLLAFTLAFVASLGTFLGGLVVVILGKFTKSATCPKSTSNLIGILQASSAGVMLYMTFFDLIPESVETLGNQTTMIWFFIGIFTFGLVEIFIIGHEHDNDEEIFDIKEPSIQKTPSIQTNGLRNRKPAKKEVKTKHDNGLSEQANKHLHRTSLITFMALFLHNIPEGLGVYISALSNFRLGLQLAVAIMLHNIPEGMACAIPLWAATGSASRVLWMTLLNGLAEPFGVIIGGYILKDYMTPQVLSKSLALVAGIMACISLQELFPTAIKFSGKNVASVWLFVGMFGCFLALESVNLVFDGGHVHSHGGGGHSHSHDHSHGDHSHHHH